MTRGAHLNRVKSSQTALRLIGDTQLTREASDFYPTPRRAIDSLLAIERFNGPIWECACGDGAISNALREHGYEVISTDLVDRGLGGGVDFLLEWKPLAPNIVTNPPFKLALPFAIKALSLTSGKVAMLLKLAFLEGVERSRFFAGSPLSKVLVFSQRLSFTPGGSTPGRKLEGGGMMAFAWFVWDHAHQGPPVIGWL